MESETLKTMMSSKDHDWGTPQELFDRLDMEFGFTLDVCATADNTKCERFFSPDLNGLGRDWCEEICFMNPPYGDAIKNWMAKAYLASTRGATVVCLVPSRTDTNWWHNFAMRGNVRFVKGRIKFIKNGSKDAAPFPSAVVVFTPP